MQHGFETLRILLVDDNDHVRAIVGAVLNGLGVREIVEASDGQEAMAILRETACDLALVDFLMSPGDGAQFTRQIRTASDSPNVFLPIIMMTGHSERAALAEARDAGVTEFVVKPITAAALLARMVAVIHRPRSFIRTTSFFGPDRRRRTDLVYAGPRRRREDGLGGASAFAI